MLPEGIVAFEKALISLRLGSVHEVHVLDPSLHLGYHGEPDARKYMDEDQEEDGHHHNLEVYFDVLRKVRSLNRCVQPAQAEQLK